jgi:cell wall-associated NlpC family hydrolase
MRPLRHVPALVISALLAAIAATALLAAPTGATTPPAATDGADAGLLEVATVRLPETLLRAAYGFLGKPYASAGTGEAGTGFDCSGLVYRTFHDAAGLELSRSVSGLYASGRAAGTPLHVGDLLFFDTVEGGPKGTPDHVGIYAGGGSFVHAASEGSHRGVTVSTIGQEYYRSRYVGARRLLAWNAPSLAVDVTDASPALPGREEVAIVLPPGAPLRLLVACEREGGRFVTLTAFRDGQEAFRRRLRTFPGSPGVAILQPGIGDWLVNVTLPGDQVLAAIRFRVGE